MRSLRSCESFGYLIFFNDIINDMKKKVNDDDINLIMQSSSGWD